MEGACLSPQMYLIVVISIVPVFSHLFNFLVIVLILTKIHSFSFS